MEKYIVITGGQMFNKGAEAMLYLAVDELKQKHPDASVVVLSSHDYKRPTKEKENYDFEILPRAPHMLYALTKGKLGLVDYVSQLKMLFKKKRPYIKELYRLEKILEKTIMMVDISGYALSDQFSVNHSLSYLSRIEVAKVFNIPFYIMPQSFGPFNYNETIKPKMDKLISENLKYPEVVFAREKEGYNILKNDYNLNENLHYSLDSVLVNKELNIENVFKKVPKLKTFDDINGVAIIPNMKTFKHGDQEGIIESYKEIVNILLQRNQNVYIVRHSFEDIEACRIIKSYFQDNSSVILLEDDMSCLEFDILVDKFNFIIGSRFHSIVHAYKNSTPSIAIGWATKYHELLEAFDQSEYIFDVRSALDVEKLATKINKMINNYDEESKKISHKLEEVQLNNPYDLIP